MDKKLTGALLAVTAAALFVTGQVTTAGKAFAAGKVKCAGVNSCKGKGDCSSAKQSCKGKNTCKGKGWVFEESEAACKKKGGTVQK